MSDRKTKASDESVAAHPDESNRHEGHAAPGAGLAQRQDRNSARTEEAQTGHKEGAHTDKPDRTKP